MKRHTTLFLTGLVLAGTAEAQEPMQGAEQASKHKSSVVFKSKDSLKDPDLKLSAENLSWWRNAKFGMFIHWGLYAIPAQGEWFMHNQKIPAAEYAKLADQFVPKRFDAATWAQAAKDAGMKYMVLTARHHDGFALWDSPASDGGFCSAKTAAKRDFVKEYVEACRGAGLAVGLYYSPMDWRFPGYFDPKGLPDSAARMKAQGYGQLRELMGNYGKIDVLWYDGGWLAHRGTDAEAAWFWEPLKLNRLVRDLQPGAVINPRSGWEGDFQCDEGGHDVSGPIIDAPWEKCLNLNKPSWGYNTKQKLMTPQDIVRMLVNVVGRGGNVLLNVGPDADGVIPPDHVEILRQVGQWLAVNGKGVYGTRPGPLQPLDRRYCATSHERSLFVHVLDWGPEQKLALPALGQTVLSARILGGQPVAYTQSPEGVTLTAGSVYPGSGFPEVVELTFERELAAVQAAAAPVAKPNIVYILCDDLGYGDVRCLNPQGKIPTPNMDRLAKEGMAFTDAHSSSSVCTPSRYSILTGRYNWRSRLKRGVLGGYSRRLLEPDRVTVAAFLRQQGYATACVGKWHLGMDWPQKDGQPPGSSENPAKIDFAGRISGGPTELGFDSFYGISASLDMPPYVYIENDRVTRVPTKTAAASPAPGFYRAGPLAEDFVFEDVLPTLANKASDYIAERAGEAKKGRPFFLYLALASPHTPILPTKEWQGRSGLNAYADFVMQTDAMLGRVLEALDRQGLAQDTLVIFTSDNGCSPMADYPALLPKGHNPSHLFRGTKSDVWEGGHRIPFLVRWPARVKAGVTSDRTICQSDLFATCGDLLGQKPADTMAEDSVSFLPTLLGAAQTPREEILHSAIFGAFAIRQGAWKLVLCPDSGGWSEPTPGSPEALKLPPVQLYDLSNDPGETTNVQAGHPDLVASLTKILERRIAEGRSTPGKPQPNTGAVDLYPQAKRVKPKAK